MKLFSFTLPKNQQNLNTQITTLILSLTNRTSLSPPTKALNLFDKIPIRNLSGISSNNHSSPFKLPSFPPNSGTLARSLSACHMVLSGSQLHAFSVKVGHEFDVFVQTAIITMYSNCGHLGSAEKAFRLALSMNVVTYNAMISGFIRNACPREGVEIFREMLEASETPNTSTFVSIVSGCSNIYAPLSGRELHCYLLKRHLVYNVKIVTSIINMYAKSGRIRWAYNAFSIAHERNSITWNTILNAFFVHRELNAATELFQRLESEGFVPDVATWNIMVSGFSHNGNKTEAFRYFRTMQFLGLRVFCLHTNTSLLECCASTFDHRHGTEIHGHVIRTYIDIGENIFNTALVHFYMKCGSPIQAHRVFDRVDNKFGDSALWNVMISGYGRNGCHDSAIELFKEMTKNKVAPNSATFVAILSACAHSGNVGKGLDIFQMMGRVYWLSPKPEHYGCMIDLLGRAGRLKEALELLEESSCDPNKLTSAYFSLLGACQNYCDAKIGGLVARKIWEVEACNPTPFVVLGNIYAAQGRWDDVNRLRENMSSKGIRKNTGYSWIDVNL